MGPHAGPSDEADLRHRVELVARIGLFQSVSPVAATDVARVLRPQPVASGEVIVREGDPGDALFVIEHGTVAVEALVGARPERIARLGPGEFFGEGSVLDGQPRTATVRAEVDGLVWRIDGADLRQLLAQQPLLAEAVERTASFRRLYLPDHSVERVNLAELAADKGEVRIGRAPDNDVVLESLVVSRHHAVVRREGDGHVLVDLGSGNGTFLNGADVRSARLKDGDTIWIGEHRLSYAPVSLAHVVEPHGVRIDGLGLRKDVGGGKTLLQDVSLTILPGELVAIVGGSGAGKSTLMDALAGVRPPTGGQVLYNGEDLAERRALYRRTLGYVPQDDIIHTALPVRVTLELAARLRLPLDTSADERRAAVDGAIAALGLERHADTRVAALSGGQRKRASIGVELLTRPRVFFLDEPTSGLDPATDTAMVRLLHDLSRRGSTIVLTTHATKNVLLCDRVIVMAPGGHLAFVGTPPDALAHFGVAEFDEIYDCLEGDVAPEEWGARFRAVQETMSPPPVSAPSAAASPAASPTGRGGLRRSVRQFLTLSRRQLALYARDTARLAPLVVQPLGFAALCVALFRPDLFRADSPEVGATVLLTFILVFSVMLFGLIFGVQEIVSEYAIFRRERLVDLRIAPYVLSKLVVLVPALALGSAGMLGILRLTDRLPDAGGGVYGQLLAAMVLSAVVGVAMALFTSSIAASSQQGNDLVPAWIMPQVLFAGGLFPIAAMIAVGEAISVAMPLRYAFQAAAATLGITDLFEAAPPEVGGRLMAQYGDQFDVNIGVQMAILGGVIVMFLVVTGLVLRRRTRV